MEIGVVIGLYNEEEIIKDTVEKIREFLRENENYTFFLVNDGSTDNTYEIIKKETENDEKINVISYEKNRGKGCAVRTGMLAAAGDAVIFTDADLAYGLDTVKKMGDEFEKCDAHLIIGNRHIEKGFGKDYGFMRKLASFLYLKYISLFFGIKIGDSQCGIKGYRAPYDKKIFSLCETDGFAFDFETIMLARKMKLKIAEMPVKIKQNNKNSKVHIFRDSIKMMGDLRKIKKRVKKIKTE